MQELCWSGPSMPSEEKATGTDKVQVLCKSMIDTELKSGYCVLEVEALG
jgi:hypothetical protein